MNYIPKYFTLKELTPIGFPQRWENFDDRILRSADDLRRVFGPLWCNGYGLDQCGLRIDGSMTSQHKFGRALDLHSNKYSSFEIRKFIIENPKMFPYITFLEVDRSWVHVDTRNCDPIQLWSPKRGFIDKEEYLKAGDLIK
jgi:hypothetical protein